MPDHPDAAPPVDDNPYEAPAARLELVVDASSEWVAIRRAHIRRETSLRSVGVLYWIGAGLCGFGAAAMLVGSVAWSTREPVDGIVFAIGGMYAVFTAVFAAVGWGFRTLSPWVRWVGGILSVLGLLAFPLGTLINGYILFLLFSPKGARVFAPDYADIRAATPHVRFRRGLAEKLVMGGILAALLAVLAWLIWWQ
jgi:hypothetical protein